MPVSRPTKAVSTTNNFMPDSTYMNNEYAASGYRNPSNEAPEELDPEDERDWIGEAEAADIYGDAQ